MSSIEYPRPNARIHLALFQPFSPNYDWSTTDRLEDYYDFDKYAELVQSAERGLFSTVFLGESLRLREHLGKLNDIAITGRPDALVLYAYLAAKTRHIGLVATLNTTYSDPVDLARRLASVDLLTAGRAGWNIVTTDNAWTGENFRRGGFLPNSERYTHAEDYVAAVEDLWDGFPTGSIASSPDAAAWSAEPRQVRRQGKFSSIDATPQVPGSPQGQPVYFQAGDSDEGRDFAARRAEGIFTHHIEFDDAVAFTADIRRRARSYGRPGDDIKIFPGANLVVAETDAEAAEKAAYYKEFALNDRAVRQAIESVWGTDLSTVDLDGPLPEFDPVASRQSHTHGIVHTGHEPTVKSRQWRALAEEDNYSVRQLVHHLSERRGFVGSASTVADQLAHYVRSDAFDGLNVTPHAFPDGLNDVVELLVPTLQERGIYPSEYPGSTLRENLGLPETVAHRVPEAAALNLEEAS
ncbi:NtaA/DmoA family FMN-dependent monooxygenase [Paenarthrobacter sp. NPDC018779]|uniref:NtaA/DmoA family FMN-dependent monooxygenase n=1 Tax=Paenarthrobacter sp. NPDC018779 TaxID=3364375 RepID=UPI0037C6D78B